MPTMSESAREGLIESALEAARDDQSAERPSVPWRGERIIITTVPLPIDAVVLNPHSHRIRSQLQSCPEWPRLQADPYGDEAQALVARLLRETDGFDRLKGNLEEVGQLDPGVVTHKGVLINANRRCVAMRDVGQHHIRTAVLPSDGLQEDFARVELGLQMKVDFKTDYTFTNELLFVEELGQELRYSDEDIAREMNWAESSNRNALTRGMQKVEQWRRMLCIVREVMELSQGAIPLTWFDEKRQVLDDLDRAYEALQPNSPERAQALRDARILAMLLDAGYREIREIHDDFLDSYLTPAMEEEASLRDRAESLTTASEAARAPQEPELPGLDALGGDQPAASSGRSLAPLVSLLARTHGQETVEVEDNSGNTETVSRDVLVGGLQAAVGQATADAGIVRRQENNLARPRALVREATRKLRSAQDIYARARSRAGFSDSEFRQAWLELRARKEITFTAFRRPSRAA